MKHENRHLRKTGRYSSWSTSIKTKMSRWIEMIRRHIIIGSHLKVSNIKYPHLFCFYHISASFSFFIHLPNVCSFIKGMLNCHKYTLKTFLCKSCSWNQLCLFLRFVLFLQSKKTNFSEEPDEDKSSQLSSWFMPLWSRFCEMFIDG